MNRSPVVGIALLVLVAGYVAFRATTHEMGKVYVRAVDVNDEAGEYAFTKHTGVDPSFRDEDRVELSWPRTIGLWIAGFLTLSIFSFLYGDNLFYRFAEALFIGVSAAYVMVVAFWTGIVQNLFGKLVPDLMRAWATPGLPETQHTELIYLVPLVLCGLMLMRLSPVGGWVSRYPIAFFIGATAGIRLLGHLESDFVRQIQNTVMPIVVMAADGSFDLAGSIRNFLVVAGVTASLVYFFFSIEHVGVVGGVSKVGIWILMVTFGASFAYTVMGRIALIAQRIEFLLDDWLWLIDPIGKRVGL